MFRVFSTKRPLAGILPSCDSIWRVLHTQIRTLCRYLERSYVAFSRLGQYRPAQTRFQKKRESMCGTIRKQYLIALSVLIAFILASIYAFCRRIKSIAAQRNRKTNALRTQIFAKFMPYFGTI